MLRPPKRDLHEDFFGKQESHKREYMYNSKQSAVEYLRDKLPSSDLRSVNELDGVMLEEMSSDIKTILESVKETNEIVNTIRKDQMAVLLKESGKENVEESSTTTKPPETTTTLEPEHENNGNCKIIRPQSCLELLNASCNQSGVYSVYPTKGEKDLVEVYCDQEIDGGGWNVFLRRQDGSVDFYKNWEQYKEGFGDLEGEFWLGLDNIHNLLSTNLHYELRVDLENFDQRKVHASYNNFSVRSETENYVLTAEGYSGDAENGLWGHSGEAFSTFDRDNDKEGTSCARYYHGAWWYRYCFRSNLCGQYYDPADDHGPYYLNYFKWKSTSFVIKFAEMKFRQLRENV